MTDQPPVQPAAQPAPVIQPAQIRPADQRRRRFAAIWLIPIVALVVTVYLGVRSYASHGPLIVVTFKTADGLNAGQTQVKYKAVPLGTVEEIQLKPDRSGVQAKIRMNAAAEPMLTDQAHFWVVRPRLSAASISSLSTLVSGTYIQLDPAKPSNRYQDHFTGLESPPDITPDDPGTVYVLKAEHLGAVNVGSAVYYRDMEVGQVISTDGGDGFAPITLTIFVRAPYDQFVRADSRLWSASGLSVRTGAGGFQIQMQSFQAFMIGGIAFGTPQDAIKEPQAPSKAEYVFYPTQAAAEASVTARKLAFVTYIQSPIKDLAAGSPVEIFGIPVGQVTDVRLAVDPAHDLARIRVAFEIRPERALGNATANPELEAAVDQKQDYVAIMKQMVSEGMRAKIESNDIVLGQQIVSLEFTPQASGTVAGSAAQTELPMEEGAIVLPGDTGGIGNVTQVIGDIAAKLNSIPFDQIGANLNHLLAGANQTVNGKDMQEAIHSLAITLANARDLSRTAKENATPALQRLPDISAQLQQAVEHANAFVGSVDTSFGAHSDFNRNARQALDQANDAARSIRLLADYLQRHPEALIQGKTLSKGTPAVDPQPAVPSVLTPPPMAPNDPPTASPLE